MNSSPENNSRYEAKPTEISRWEGEGGQPPDERPKRHPASPASVAGILRRMLIDFHIINSRGEKR